MDINKSQCGCLLMDTCCFLNYIQSKLSDVLSAEQKKNKITNLLSYLRIHNVIMVNEKKKWVLVK